MLVRGALVARPKASRARNPTPSATPVRRIVMRATRADLLRLAKTRSNLLCTVGAMRLTPLSDPAAISRRLPAVLALVAALLAAGCGGSSKPTVHYGTPRNPLALNGARASPPFHARPLALRDYRGRPVDIAAYRGKAVLVTFIYTHCPDVCPLIVGNLHTAQTELGPRARQVKIIAVSVDPRGDTPKAVRKFLKAHQMLGRMDYLIGGRSQLEAVWRRWGILSKADPRSPDQVEHSALIYDIGASGTVYTLYPANFKPHWLVHDVPLLATH